MIRTRLKHHKSRYPHVIARQDKFMDLSNWDYIVEIAFECRKCGEKKRRVFRDRDEYPFLQAHRWFGERLGEHGHREQGILRLTTAV